MRRISLALALLGAAAAGCGGSAPSNQGGARGVGQGTFKVTVQNGQPMGGSALPNPSLQIKGGYVASADGNIDCGGATRTRCDFEFPVGTAVVLTAVPDTTDPVTLVLGWAGDCSGLGTTCTLTGNADKYVVVEFGTASDRTYHPNWSDPRAHGAEVVAGTFTCTDCHGANLQGQGIAVNCAGCHDSTLLDGVKAVQATPSTTKIEKCGLCHETGAYDASAKHAITGKVTFSATPVVLAANATDLEFTVNVKVDGVNSNAFTTNSGGYRFAYVAAREAATVSNAFERFSLTAGTNIVVAPPVNGDYKVTLVGAGSLTGNQTFVARLTDNNADAQARLYVTAVSHFNGPARDLVGNAACVNCHADQVFRHREANGEFHHGANPYGVEACVVCHTRYGSTSRSMGGDRTTAYVHGVHASHQMPARDITQTVGGVPYTVTKPAGVYARNDSLAVTDGVARINSPFSIGFPTYMNNCSTCHDTDARLTAVMAKPVSASTCMSCHDNWDGFVNTRVGGSMAFHRTTVLPLGNVATANACATCHNGTIASATVGAYHAKRQQYTARNGLLFDGKDQSIEQGKRLVMTVDSVTPSGTNLVVTWSATFDGAAVNPCNSNIATGPVFIGATANATTGQSASNMNLLQAYAQGNDWVNEGNGTSPGQPIATNLTGTNTNCAGNVATSTIAAASTSAEKGVVSLQGKAQITFTSGAYSRVIQLRSPSPVREFVVASGAEPTVKRRQIVSNDKCLACHPGSLYQHGGNRVDSVDLCVTCHNPASNEKNVRAGMGVDASEAYDGKAGQTYDLRYMLHAIHSAGETGALLVFYRTNGIYAFGSQAAIDAIPNWPGAGSFRPYGAFDTEPNRNHNEIVIHYPRALNDCDACHVNGSENNFPDQTQAMAVTVNDSGATQASASGAQAYTGAVNSDLQDDVLMGAAAASCMSCHQSGVASEQANLRRHAYDFGWTPSTFDAGRETLINFAVCGAATCP